MKTKLSLTVIGVIMILQSIAYPLFSETFTDMMFNVGDEAKEALTLFQIAVAPTFFMVGLMMLMARSTDIKTAKNLLLAFIIGYIPAFIAFYNLASSPMTNAGIGDFIPDILMFSLAIFTYIKPKI
jgi:RsiW-degrading membrane proteinase PrsW (M82 family)